MPILVIGGTVQVGSRVLQELGKRGRSARVLTREPAKAKLPDGFEPVRGDLLDPRRFDARLRALKRPSCSSPSCRMS